MDQEIFTLISKEEERIKLWKDLAQAKADILCKGSAEALCKVKAVLFIASSKHLECQFQDTRLNNLENYLGYFFIGGEKYYFQSQALIQEGHLKVSLPKELWHLQRRQNYRVKIPSGFTAKFKLLKINETVASLQGSLIDLSSQGCKIQCKTDGLRLEDRVSGELHIDNKPAIHVQGIVRHIKGPDAQTQQVLGIEFNPLDTMTENKLFAWTMEIHKKHFKSW